MDQPPPQSLPYASPLHLLRAPVAEYDAAADTRLVRVIGASVWLICAILAAVMLPVWPPTRSLGQAGWTCAAVFISAVTLTAVRTLQAEQISLRLSLLVDVFTVVGLGLLSWLCGGESEYSSLIALVLAFVGGSQAPRRTIAVTLLALLMLPLALSAQHFHSATVVSDLVTMVFWLLLVTMATAWNAGVRWQRLALRHSEDLAQHQAHHDPVTGLGNRHKLMQDLQALLDAGQPSVLALFDLNGFKSYNDTFGHPAGDALLERLGGKLDTAVQTRGSAYRLGGDEFVLLVPAGTVDSVVRLGCGALTEGGQGFNVTAAGGGIAMPQEASSASEILRLADQRMYAQKYQRRPSSPAYGTRMLTALIQERYPNLSERSEIVTARAVAVGERLGLKGEQAEQLRLAAEVHDVGKLGIPESILEKPGPLSAEEWVFVRQHTLVGERVLAAAPPLIPIGKIVRSCHERVDGCGYPDGLSGEDIPLAARVISVCDAYDAMTSARPYRQTATSAEAMVELRRAAGTQFDPRVVEAFADTLAASPGQVLELQGQ